MALSTNPLTKKDYLTGLKCPLKLYRDRYGYDGPEGLVCLDPDAEAQRRMKQGKAVGEAARGLFQGGLLISETDFLAAVDATEKALASAPPAIFEGAFECGNVRVRTDILERTGKSDWNLLEVKAKARREDPDYIDDLAIQYWVLTQWGVSIASAAILHLNGEYEGGQPLAQLFVRTELTDQVRQRVSTVKEEVSRLLDIIGNPEPPEVLVVPECRTCPYFPLCGAELPEHWVGEMPRLSPQQWEALCQAGLERESIGNIPISFKLTGKQQRIRQAVISGSPYVSAGLVTVLNLTAPIYYLDFETIHWAIPPFPGVRPWQHVPFQYSIHVQYPDGSLEHREYLHRESDDPRPKLAERLVQDLGDKGPIVVYTDFEQKRLDELVTACPNRTAELKSIKDRLLDLHKVLQEHYYHPGFHGSFSLKDVLPVLVPEMSYDDLAIQDGSEAMLAYDRLLDDPLSVEERENLAKSLMDYCCWDTLALVRVVEVLQQDFAGDKEKSK